MKNIVKKIATIAETAVSLCALSVAILIAIYMVVSFSLGIYNFILNLPDILAVMSSADYSKESIKQRHEFEVGMLHAIAFIIVLIKAFKILMSYAQTHHLNIKYRFSSWDCVT